MPSTDTASIRRGGLGLEWVVLLVVVPFASLVALLATDVRCGGFTLSSDARSTYCKTLNLPNGPNSVTSMSLSLVIFALPTIAVAASAIAAPLFRRSLLRRTVACCILLIAVSFALVAFAHSVTPPVD